MIIYLHEYNVTPDVNKRNELIIKVEDNSITYNDINDENDYLANKIKEMLISYKDTLLHAKDIKFDNSKGGRQKQLSIYCEEICAEKIVLAGNTNNEEIAKLYDEIKNKLISLLEN